MANLPTIPTAPDAAAEWHQTITDVSHLLIMIRQDAAKVADAPDWGDVAFAQHIRGMLKEIVMTVSMPDNTTEDDFQASLDRVLANLRNRKG